MTKDKNRGLNYTPKGNVRMAISGSYSEKKLFKVLMNNEILCDIAGNESIVFNKIANEYRKEQGHKVNIYKITNKKLLNVWLKMREILKINCIWLDMDKEKYHGCIVKYFSDYSAKNGIACSEYA